MKVLHTLPSYECPRRVIRRHAYARLVLLLMFTASCLPLVSQQFATVNVTVTDPSGSVIAQANVSVQNVDTGVVRAAVSDKLGLTVIPGLPAGQLGFVKRQFPNAYSEQANLEIENELGNGWHLTAGYHYLHAVHLLSSSTINGIPDGFLSDGRQKFSPADPGFGFALYATPSGWSIYNAGSLTLRKILLSTTACWPTMCMASPSISLRRTNFRTSRRTIFNRN